MKIAKYNIIYKYTLAELIEAVNAMLPFGWQPFEQPVCDNAKGRFYQAIVKYESKESVETW